MWKIRFVAKFLAANHYLFVCRYDCDQRFASKNHRHNIVDVPVPQANTAFGRVRAYYFWQMCAVYPDVPMLTAKSSARPPNVFPGKKNKKRLSAKYRQPFNIMKNKNDLVHIQSNALERRYREFLILLLQILPDGQFCIFDKFLLQQSAFFIEFLYRTFCNAVE